MRSRKDMMSDTKLLGDGTYGCVFMPDIQCSKDVIKLSNIKSSKPKISKVFIIDDSIETENKFAKLVFEWDPKGKYFVVPEKLCKTKLSNVKQHSKHGECTELKYVKDKYVSQIVMRYEGMDLKKIFKNITNKPVVSSLDITSV